MLKGRKKEASKSKQITILPRHLEYEDSHDGPIFSRDSRVHNSTISEGSSVEDWIAFLMGNMGQRPVHPDNTPSPELSSRSSSQSDDSEDDSEDEDKPEPWYLRWHRLNPILKNAPAYKKREHEQFLNVEKAKFDKSQQNHAIDGYNNAVA